MSNKFCNQLSFHRHPGDWGRELRRRGSRWAQNCKGKRWERKIMLTCIHSEIVPHTLICKKDAISTTYMVSLLVIDFIYNPNRNRMVRVSEHRLLGTRTRRKLSLSDKVCQSWSLVVNFNELSIFIWNPQPWLLINIPSDPIDGCLGYLLLPR